MMNLGRETGSLVNHMMSRDIIRTPHVGMGATILGWTDRQAGTIREVGPVNPKTKQPAWFIFQDDHAIRTDNLGMSESQRYQYEPNPEGGKTTFKQVTRGNLKGQWRSNGSKDGRGILLGHRDHYYDYSF